MPISSDKVYIQYTTCTGMPGSGARIGMARITMRSHRWTIRVVLQQARTACVAAAAAGTATPSTAGRRTVAGPRLSSGTSAWAFVSPEFRRTSQVKVSERPRVKVLPQPITGGQRRWKGNFTRLLAGVVAVINLAAEEPSPVLPRSMVFATSR